MHKGARTAVTSAVLVAAVMFAVDSAEAGGTADGGVAATAPVINPAIASVVDPGSEPGVSPNERPGAKKRFDPWEASNDLGIPLAMAAGGWGDVPANKSGIGWEKWTYENYPIACSPASSPLPAYQVIWVTNASRPRSDTVLDTRPGLLWKTFRRVSSVFAASRNSAIRTPSDLEQALTPRFVTNSGSDGCRPAVDRVQVPAAVLSREDIQNWVNPATGVRERGLWSYLEEHGYPARDNRRYVAIVDDTQAPDHRWFGMKGHSIIPANDGGYAPTDLDPSQQNRNNAGGTWMTVFTNGRASDFRAGGGEFGPALAHELAHSMGAALEGSPNYNEQSFGHPTDCADLLCYNNYDQAGQHWTACSAAKEDSYRSFFMVWGSESKAAVRLDCGRDDYFAMNADGSGEKAWADQRWSGSRNRFFWGNQHRPDYVGEPFTNPEIPPSCLYLEDGYCPAGVKPELGALTRRDSHRSAWLVVS